MNPRNKRDLILDTALRLFYSHGFHATGIDRVIEAAGVARMTLYKHFASKDLLILAALRLRSERFIAWYMGEIEIRARMPEDKLLCVFDALHDWFGGRVFSELPFSGCAFINASAEFADPDNPVHRLAAEHKGHIEEKLRELAREAGASDPATLASELMLLQEGAIVRAQVSGDLESARKAKAIARYLICKSLGREVQGSAGQAETPG